MVRLTFPPPVDFQRLLLDLQHLGMKGPEIQAASGIRRGALGEYKTAACRPPYDKGEALIRVWCLRTGRARDQVPRRTSETVSAAKVVRDGRGPIDALAGSTATNAAKAIAGVARLWVHAPTPSET